MSAETILELTGAYRRSFFKLTAKPTQRRLPQTPGGILDRIRSRFLPRDYSFISVTAEQLDGKSARAELTLPGSTGWEIWLSNQQQTEQFLLGHILPTMRSQSIQLDLREPARILVMGSYMNYNQETFQHQQIQSEEESPFRFEVQVQKTRQVPNDLLEYYESKTWPENFQPRIRTLTGETGSSLETSPFIFYLLKGEDCQVSLTSPPGNYPRRTADKTLNYNWKEQIITLSLKEKLTRVTWYFEESSGNPQAADQIQFWSGSHRQMPAYSSSQDYRGEEQFEGEFRRLSDWKVSAVERNPTWMEGIPEMREGSAYQGSDLPPLSCVEHIPFPDLSTPAVSSTIQFPKVLGDFTITCPVQMMVHASDSAPVMFIIYDQVFLLNGDIYAYGIFDEVSLILDEKDRTYWSGEIKILLKKGYYYRFFCGHNWGSSWEWKQFRRLNLPGPGYKYGPFVKDETLVSLLFGVIP